MSHADPSGLPPARPQLVTSLSLLQRARGRDQEAWGRLFLLYQPFVVYWCGRRGVRREDIDDVAQEVFRAAAAGLDGFRRDRPGDTFRGWLRGITHNKVLMHFRALKGEPQAAGGSGARELLEAVVDSAEDDDPEEQLGGLYHRALELVRGEFEERTWRMFWRAVVDGREPAAVAAEMGVSDAAVRQAKSRVLRRLKEEVGELIR